MLMVYHRIVLEGTRTRCNIPPGREDEQIGQGRRQIPGFGREHAENGWINVINGDGANVDEFGQIIFVGDLTSGCYLREYNAPYRRPLT